jgi:cell division protein FtsL
VTDTSQNWIYSLAVVFLVMASAIACIYAKHESRKLFTELQGLIDERDQMEVDWGRLQIEQGTWSTYARVEQVAREKMNMRLPTAEQIHLLEK